MSTKIRTTQVATVNLIDPHSHSPVEVTIFKMSTGAMVGIDSSFLANTEEPVYSPYDRNIELDVDDECELLSLPVVKYDDYSKTIRQMPQNYLIAHLTEGAGWACHPDTAGDPVLCTKVFELLMMHENRWCVSGTKLAEIINSKL